MADRKLVVTDEVEKEIPLYIRNLLWFIINSNDEFHIGKGFHAFDLDIVSSEEVKPIQKIRHLYIPSHDSNLPIYQKEHLFHNEIPIDCAVAVKVDEAGVHTMKLKEKYNEEV